MFLTRKQTKTLKTMRYSGLLCSTAIIRYAEKNSVSTEKLCNWSRKQTFLSLIIQYQISSLRFIYLFILTGVCKHREVVPTVLYPSTHCFLSLGFLQNLLFLISSANRGTVIACWFQIGSWGDCALHMCNSQKYLKKKIVLTENSHLANTYVCGYCVIILVEGGGIGVVQMQRESESSCIDWCKIYLKCVHIKPLTTWWKHFLTLLPSSFLILPLQIPWSYFCFPIGCWLELLGKRPFHPNKPTEREGCTAVTSHLQIRAARVLCLMKTVSSSVLLFKIIQLSDFSDLCGPFHWLYHTVASLGLYVTYLHWNVMERADTAICRLSHVLYEEQKKS